MSMERYTNIILTPVLSEKAMLLGEMKNQFVFKVRKDAKKPEIKKAIEVLFKVEVDAVRVSNVKGKQKRRGPILGRRKDWKKAYVSLKEGFDIQFADVS